MQGLAAIAAFVAVLAAAPGAAGAVGELTFTNCVGPSVGCVGVPAGGLSRPLSVVASSTGSVYVGTELGVTHFFAGSGLGYDGCVGPGEGCAPPASAELMGFVYGLAMSPNGAALYTGATGGKTVGDISRLAAAPQGQITWEECWSSTASGGCKDATGGTPGVPIDSPRYLAVSPDGKSVYSADGNGAVSHFFANSATGEFSFDGCIGGEHKVQNPNCAETPEGVLTGAIGIGVSPLNQVYVLAGSEAVVHLPTDPAGRLGYEGCVGRSSLAGKCATFPGEIDPLFKEEGMTVAPNGGIYTITAEGTIAHFTTDSAGRISYADCLTSGATPGCALEGVPAAMHGMDGIAASPDARNLYVTTNDALLTFGLTATGTPVFERCIATHVAGCNAVPGVQFEAFEGVAVSPDGSAVYAVGTAPSFVARFSRTLSGSGPGGSQGPGGGSSKPTGGGSGSGKPVFCDGHRATIVGTAGKDHLRGTKHADVIAGLGGNDTIEGLAGNDYICGGPGNDRILGGAGNDHLDGEAGNDKLLGQAGADVLRGGAGNDKLEGGPGNDRLLGQAGADTLLGGPGNDKLEGGPGKDKLSGGPGRNSLHP